MDPFLRALAAPFLLGLCAGWVLLAGMLLSDAFGLHSLLLQSEVAALATAMLLFAFGTGFGCLSLGTALMRGPP